MPSKFVEFVPLSPRQGNCIPFAAIRWHDFGNRPALGRPFGRFSRHPDTPLLSLSPRRRFPRPTPERVFVADHRSGPRFSGTNFSAPRPRQAGTSRTARDGRPWHRPSPAFPAACSATIQCRLLAGSGCSAVSPRTSAVGQKADLRAPMSGFRRIASASGQRADPALKARFRRLLTQSGS